MSSTQDLRRTADRLIELHEDGDLDAVLSLADELAAAAADELATAGADELAGAAADVLAGAAADDPAAEAADDPAAATEVFSHAEVARESLFVARFERAVVLTERGEWEAAAEAYRMAADTPSDLDDPDQRHEVAMALLNLGMCQDAMGDAAGAVVTYDEVVRRFGEADDPVTRDQVVRARVNRAASLLADGSAELAAEAADEVCGVLDPRLPLDAEQWLLATRIRAAALVELGKVDEARVLLSDATTTESDDPAVIEQRDLVEEDLLALP